MSNERLLSQLNPSKEELIERIKARDIEISKLRESNIRLSNEKIDAKNSVVEIKNKSVTRDSIIDLIYKLEDENEQVKKHIREMKKTIKSKKQRIQMNEEKIEMLSSMKPAN